MRPCTVGAMVEIGRPGAHAAGLARTANIQTFGAALISVGLILWLATTPDPPVGVIVAGLVGAGFLRRRTGGVAARASAGSRSERRVGRVLAASGAGVVLHGVDLGSGGGADHVVVGPWLAVVETKTGRGRLVVRGDRVQVGGKVLVRNPFRQARQQAALVHKATGMWCDTIVCITDLDVASPKRVDSTIVCSVATLGAALRMLPVRVGPGGVERVVAALAGHEPPSPARTTAEGALPLTRLAPRSTRNCPSRR